MMLESLHSFIKVYKLKGNRASRLDELLLKLMETVRDKKWLNVRQLYRPNASDYTNRKQREHLRAVLSKHNIEKKNEELFAIKEFLIVRKAYSTPNCQLQYCLGCKLCLHQFECNCNEKGSIACSHKHAIAMLIGNNTPKEVLKQPNASRSNSGSNVDENDQSDWQNQILANLKTAENIIKNATSCEEEISSLNKYILNWNRNYFLKQTPLTKKKKIGTSNVFSKK